MDLPEAQKRLEDGFEVAKVQIWFTRPGHKLDDEEVKKAGCTTVKEYVATLEKEGRMAMGKKERAGYKKLPLCTVGKINDGVKTLLAVYEEIPDNLSLSFG